LITYDLLYYIFYFPGAKHVEITYTKEQNSMLEWKLCKEKTIWD